MTAALKAGATYFATISLVGFLLGTVRVLLLAPRIGSKRPSCWERVESSLAAAPEDSLFNPKSGSEW